MRRWCRQEARLGDYRLLAFDMDSTLITIECIDEIADYAGCKAQVAAITEAAMRGEIADFDESLRRRVALLAGLDAAVLARVFDERLRLSPGARELLAAARRRRPEDAAGLRRLHLFHRAPAGRSSGSDHAHANTLEVVDGKLTGRVLRPHRQCRRQGAGAARYLPRDRLRARRGHRHRRRRQRPEDDGACRRLGCLSRQADRARADHLCDQLLRPRCGPQSADGLRPCPAEPAADAAIRGWTLSLSPSRHAGRGRRQP